MLFNTLAPGTRAIISKEKLSELQRIEGSKHHNQSDKATKNSNTAVSEPYDG